MQLNLLQLFERPDFLPLFNEWDWLRGKRIGITGHRGVLGSLFMHRFHDMDIKIDIYHHDITDSAAFSRWIQLSQPDILFHLAALVPLNVVASDPIAAMRTNAIALLDIQTSISTYAPDCWLFLASSSHVYTPRTNNSIGQLIPESSATIPTSLYGATKLAAENIILPLAKHSNTKLCIGRIFSYFHEQQAESFFIPGLAKRIINTTENNTIDIVDSNSIRDFLYAESVVDAILFLCARGSTTTVNIGSGIGRSIGDVAKIVLEASKKNISLNYLISTTPTGLVADIEKLKSIIKLKNNT